MKHHTPQKQNIDIIHNTETQNGPLLHTEEMKKENYKNVQGHKIKNRISNAKHNTKHKKSS
jgi:hypothetical protein